MGVFASGVTVVSGIDDGEPVGFACQSFASVSLRPPLVLFCADHRGRAWPRIRHAGRFTVNVLAERQDEICARFGSSRGQKFEGLPWRESGWGTPALDDVLLRVHCAVHDVHVAGDHDVVIGRVLAIDEPADGVGGSDNGPEAAERPMIFYRGRFGIDVDHPDEPTRPTPDQWGWGDHWG